MLFYTGAKGLPSCLIGDRREVEHRRQLRVPAGDDDGELILWLYDDSCMLVDLLRMVHDLVLKVRDVLDGRA